VKDSSFYYIFLVTDDSFLSVCVCTVTVDSLCDFSYRRLGSR
jgi:hypothetical protein